MSTSHIYHAHGIRKFQLISEKFVGKTIEMHIRRKGDFACPNCESSHVTAIKIGKRKIKGLKSGRKNTVFIVILHRIKCHDCGSFLHEDFEFTPAPKVHYTCSLARTVIELREEMSINAIAKYLNLHWGTVKDIEKRFLKKKYKKIKLKDVRYIGIDEVYVGHNKYLTIVRDMESGAVLHIGEGKGGEALDKFAKRLRHSKCKIVAAAVDFAPSYSAWIKENLPSVDIVYDHFHLIKLMNKKINALRRSTMNDLDDHLKEKLKGKRWLFLRNQKNLDEEETDQLNELKEIFDDLGTACYMRDALRQIYSIAEFDYEAKLALKYWCELADETNIGCLHTMAKTIRKNMDGIAGYWKYNHLTNAKMEGFNNKIGWLNRQAYGYRDFEYFKLKIFDLPTCKFAKAI